jgi:membrane protein
VLRVVQARSEDLAWAGNLSDDLGLVWTLLAYAIPFAFSLIAFTVLYTLVPSRARNLGNALPGALGAAVLFELVKFGFSFYVTRFRDFDVVYGSLGAVMTFLFWLYLCSTIMLLGAELAVVYGQVKVEPVKQPRFSGMGVPLHKKIVRAARSLFVRETPPTTPR